MLQVEMLLMTVNLPWMAQRSLARKRTSSADVVAVRSLTKLTYVATEADLAGL